jgi:hypothetical protein
VQLPRIWQRLLHITFLALASVAIVYTFALLFLALQAFAPEVCTSFVCRQVRVPGNTFGRMLFFGFNAGLLSLTWLAVYLLAHVRTGEPAQKSGLSARRWGGVAALSWGAVALFALAVPLLVAAIYLFLIVEGAVVAALLLVLRS